MSVDPKQLYDELKGLLDLPSPPGPDGRIWSYCPMHGDGAKHGKKAACRPGAHDHGRTLSLHPLFGVECKAGCTPKGNKAAFEKMIALLRQGRPRETAPSQQRPDGNERRRTATPKWHDVQTGEDVWGIPSYARLSAIYEYRSPRGELVALKGRWDYRNPETGEPDKTFKWRRPDRAWSQGLYGAGCARDGHADPCDCLPVSATPLWHGEEIGGLPADAPLWFVEGEKACTALRDQGEHAYCLGGGGSQTSFGEAFEPFRGHPVRLWPDNDEPGMKYMANVRKALAGVARTVTLINAPVKPKGDAHDYFEAGGSVANLLDGVLDGVAVKVVSDDHFQVRVPSETGVVAMEFRDLVHTRAGARAAIHCELEVRCLGPGSETTPYMSHPDLLSQSARSALETALNKQFGKDMNWTVVVSQAWGAVLDAYNAIDRAIDFEALPDAGESDGFLVKPLLPEGVTTIFFANGGSGKSIVMMGLAAAVAFGSEFLGLPVKRQANVLYVDWETSGVEAKKRRNRVLEGMGFHQSEFGAVPMHYWPARGIPLSDQLTNLRRAIERHDIGFVIIDSGAVACGGRPEDSEVATQFFRDLARLECTVAVVCHVTKESMKDGRPPDMPFGSAFWHNLARRTWFISRASEPGSELVELGLYCKKANDGPVPQPIGIKMTLESEGGPITFERMNADEITGAWSLLDDWEKVRQFIREQPQGVATLKAMAQAMQMDPRAVYQQILMPRRHNRRLNKGLFVALGGGEGSADQEWALFRGYEEEQAS